MALANMEVTSSRMVKPLHPRPHLDGPHVPLTIFDLTAENENVPMLFAFRPPTPDNAALTSSLAVALRHYPHLAGRFASDPSGLPCILLNDHGVHVAETNVPARLDDRLLLHSSASLYPRGSATMPLQLQLNRFACGGLVLGVTAHHHALDGASLSCFLRSWATVARGEVPHWRPCHDRDAIVFPRHCRSLLGKLQHAGDCTSEGVTTVETYFSRDFIAMLREKAGEEDGMRYSTSECLLAHMWKKVVHVRGLDGDGDGDTASLVQIAVNGRVKVRPRLSPVYFGNCLLSAFVEAKAGEVASGSYAQVARLVRSAVARVDDVCVESLAAEMPASVPAVLGGRSRPPDLDASSWLRLGFERFNFGGGGPSRIVLLDMPKEGEMVLVPACGEQGGVHAFLCLREENVQAFLEIRYHVPWGSRI